MTLDALAWEQAKTVRSLLTTGQMLEPTGRREWRRRYPLREVYVALFLALGVRAGELWRGAR